MTVSPNMSDPVGHNHIDARIHSLEQALATAEQALAAVQNQVRLYQSVVDSIPSVVYATDLDGHLLLVNAPFAATLGMQPAAMIGRHQRDFFPADLVAYWKTQTDQVVLTGQPQITEEESPGPDGTYIFLSQRSPIIDSAGRITAIAGIATDITDRRRADQEREQLQANVIAAQEHALHELSTPLIPLTDGVLVMPLVGTLDASRAQQIMATLLEGVGRHRATQVILDITGLPVVDTVIASVLIQAAQATKLLGAEVLLTGIGPEVAQTLVDLGADMRTLKTPGTLQNGIAYALATRARAGR